MKLLGRRRPGPDPVGTEFDQDTAHALAVVTLLTSGRVADVDLAGRLVDELLTADDGAQRMAQGMAAVSGGLLALLEFFASVPASHALAELGRAIAEATEAQDPRPWPPARPGGAAAIPEPGGSR